jgi:hypothetical protein
MKNKKKILRWMMGMISLSIVILVVFHQFWLDLYFFRKHSGDDTFFHNHEPNLRKDYYPFKDQLIQIPDDVLDIDAISTTTLAAGEHFITRIR